MRLIPCARFAAHAVQGLAAVVLAALVMACSGGSDSASPSASGSAATSAGANSVVAVIDEGSEVAAYIGKSAAITVRFSASQGTVTALKLQPPATPGWQSADGKLGCDSVSADQPCKLSLLYAPKAFAASATLKLSYSYVDSAGVVRNDSLPVNYRTLPANAATVALSPAGTVSAVVGAARAVTLSFATSDGSAASALHVDLSALPSGWSGGAPAFDCASFGGGNACQLALSYEPAAAAAQTSFDLSYSYLNSAGNARSGKQTIAYTALMPNTVSASIAPAGMALASPGTSQDVTLTFQPSDGNAASALQLSDSAAFPAGWSIKSSTLPCATVNVGSACQLVLAFAPTASLPQQQLDLGFDYVNAAGQAQHGTASVSYGSRIYRAYVADYTDASGSGGGVRQCEVDAEGSLLNCAQAPSTWPAPSTNRVLVSGAHAYVSAMQPAANAAHAMSVCGIDKDGGLANCADAGFANEGISGLALLGQYAYLISSGDASAGSAHRLTGCTLNDSGGLQQGGCAQLSLDAAGVLTPAAMTAFNSALYFAAMDAASSSASLVRCTLDLFGGTQLQCQPFQYDYPPLAQALAGVTVTSGDYLYLLSADGSAGAIVKCNLAPNGTVSGCDGSKLPDNVAAADLAQARDIAVSGKQVYIALAAGIRKGVLRCAIDEANGDVLSCVSAGDTGSVMPVGLALR